MTNSRVIGCISAKGGVGKTTTAINLAAALNFFGKEVTLLDANLTTPDVGVYLGFPIPAVTLHDVLKGKKETHEAVMNHKSGVKILPASISIRDAKKFDHSKLDGVISDLHNKSDFIIVDSSPGMSKDAITTIRAMHEVIIVTSPEMPAVTDALKTVKLCKELKKTVLGVLVTKTNAKNPDMSFKDIESILEIPIIGIIPEDRSVKFALASKEPVVNSHPKSAASVQYKRLAADIMGIKYNERIEMPGSNFFDGVLRYLGFKE
jgi:septum site-determining protein MinD